jgi:hypothetical protein
VPPLSTTLCPAHTAEGTELIFTVGVGARFMVTLLVSLHPFTSVPITVYVVVAVGVLTTIAPLVVFKVVPELQV